MKRYSIAIVLGCIGKGSARARLNSPIFWNWTHKNILIGSNVSIFENRKKISNHSAQTSIQLLKNPPKLLKYLKLNKEILLLQNCITFSAGKRTSYSDKKTWYTLHIMLSNVLIKNMYACMQPPSVLCCVRSCNCHLFLAHC